MSMVHPLQPAIPDGEAWSVCTWKKSKSEQLSFCFQHPAEYLSKDWWALIRLLLLKVCFPLVW